MDASLALALLAGGFTLIGTVTGVFMTNWLAKQGRREQRAYEEELRVRERLLAERERFLSPDPEELPAARQAVRSGGILLPRQGPQLGSVIRSILPFNTRAACFRADTLVLLSDGDWRPIEQLSVGDSVRAYDAASHTILDDVIQDIHVGQRDDLVLINRSVAATANQEVFCNGSYVPAASLPLQGVMLSSSHEPVIVNSIERLAEAAPGGVFGLQLEAHHGYYVRGTLDTDAILVAEVATGKTPASWEIG